MSNYEDGREDIIADLKDETGLSALECAQLLAEACWDYETAVSMAKSRKNGEC
jgi:hypothetical protein